MDDGELAETRPCVPLETNSWRDNVMHPPFHYALAALSMLLFMPNFTTGPVVHPRFDLATSESGPFPSDRFTVADSANLTGRRVDLPMPNCVERPSDCQDIAVINRLDGFNIQPRISIPFDAPIDPHSVSSDTVFLVKLPCGHDDHTCDEGPAPQKIGINQVVWDTATNTLHVESDELLDQHTRYALIVTRGVRGASGAPVASSPAFQRFRQTVRGAYKDMLLDAMHAAAKAGVPEDRIAVASAFTTQSVTAVMEKMRDQIKAGPASVTDFILGPGGSRTVFALDDVASVSLRQQTGTTPTFNTVNFTLAELRSEPRAVGQIAFGRFLSRDYRMHADAFIPPVGTRTGTPTVFGAHEIYFNLVLPSGTPPPDGWPIAIFGTVGGGNKEGVTLGIASRLAVALARHGIALITINSVGHGFGPLGSLSVNRTTGEPVTFAAGGRGIDLNADGLIESTEGIRAAAPRLIIDDSDGFRQTVADLMQLVRQIEAGVDVDDDALPDLDPSRVYYVSQSLGSMYGALLLALDPGVRIGVLNAVGGPRTTRTLTARGGRAAIGSFLAARGPSLINVPGITALEEVAVPAPPHYNENFPLRDGVALHVTLADSTVTAIQTPVVNTVAGAMDIQQWLDRTEWVMQSASPVAYAPYFRKMPLSGTAKRVLVQVAKGDQVVPNPSSTAMIRAGNLEGWTTFYRHDLAFAENPALPKDPHGFMPLPLQFGAIAHGAQEQIAVFFASDGELTLHPEPSRFYEVPIAQPLPEALNFIR
jgi:hypothetical protein